MNSGSDEELDLCGVETVVAGVSTCLRLRDHKGQHVVGRGDYRASGDGPGDAFFTLWEVTEQGLKPIIRAETEGLFSVEEMAAVLAFLDWKAGRV